MLFILTSYPMEPVTIKTLLLAKKSAISMNVVLTGDGVYCAESFYADKLNALFETDISMTFYALEDDMILRGVNSEVVSAFPRNITVSPISMDELVEMTDSFYPVVHL